MQKKTLINIALVELGKCLAIIFVSMTVFNAGIVLGWWGTWLLEINITIVDNVALSKLFLLIFSRVFEKLFIFWIWETERYFVHVFMLWKVKSEVKTWFCFKLNIDMQIYLKIIESKSGQKHFILVFPFYYLDLFTAFSC